MMIWVVQEKCLTLHPTKSNKLSIFLMRLAESWAFRLRTLSSAEAPSHLLLFFHVTIVLLDNVMANLWTVNDIFKEHP